jgi:IPT/TIG domain
MSTGIPRLVVCAGIATLVGCLSQGPPLALRRETDDDGGKDPTISTLPPSFDAGLELVATDPHAVIGVDPSHGPWSGGQARILRGNGFGKGLRVWFGPTEIVKKDIIPVDPGRAQVIVPAGAPGPADVKAQIGDDASTARVLAGGYLYEDFFAEPASGPTSGGTVVHFIGQGTAWDAGTTVTIDEKACEPVSIVSKTELSCTVPANTPGAKSVTITGPDKISTVRDGFTYANSDDGFKGGLSGAKLAGHLKVLVYDDFSGAPIKGAFVLAGDDVDTGLVKSTDGAGVAVFDDPGLGPKRSVTIAAKCYEPTTFIDVPVDALTAFMTPVLAPACASEGDPPSVGGHGIALSTVRGELVWGEDGEFRSAAWRNVPSPIGPSEKLVAYVFRLASDPGSKFSLPTASEAVRPEIAGTIGFPFRLDTTLGNLTLYALAGIEDRSVSPPKFTPYAMGVVHGVSASPGETTSSVYIPIDIPLDHTVQVAATTPAPSSRGPDRAGFSVAVEVEKDGYAILPAGSQSQALPVNRALSFVGLPALSGALSGTRYIASAIAGTGPLLAAPLSEVGAFASTSESIALASFVPIPLLDYPAFGGAWDGRRIAVSFGASATTVDITVLRLESGGGLVTWLVAAPGGTRTITLPNLSQAFPLGALVPGNVSINVYGGHIEGFDYGNVRYRDLQTRGFDAYSLDVFPARSE